MSTATALELAQSHLRGQVALLERARGQVAAAAKARTDAEASLARRTAEHATATAASDEHRDDDALLDALARAGARSDRARADHAAALDVHASAIESLSARERFVGEAERAVERAILESRIEARAPDLTAHGRALVDAVTALTTAVEHVAGLLAADAADAARARALGSDVEASDGLGVSAGIVLALIGKGGLIRDDDQSVRWIVQPRVEESGLNVQRVTSELVALVTASLVCGPRAQDYEKVAMARRADLYVRHRTGPSAHREEEERRQREHAEQRAAGVVSGQEAIALRTRLGLIEQPARSGRYIQPGERSTPRRVTPARAPAAQTFEPRDEELPDGPFSRDAAGHETPESGQPPRGAHRAAAE